MSEHNWPVVGGVYDWKPAIDGWKSVVVGIDKDAEMVIHNHVFEGKVISRDIDTQLDVYWEVYGHEDQSPIKDLVAALEAIVSYRDEMCSDMENSPDGEDLRHFVSKRSDLWEAGRAALAKAGTR